MPPTRLRDPRALPRRGRERKDHGPQPAPGAAEVLPHPRRSAGASHHRATLQWPAVTTEPTINIERLIDLCDRIRDHVNQPRVHASLFADNTRFRQACSAMDMIGDTSQAVRAYAQLCTADVDKGTAYLVVFGALQVLYVQQDAVFWLCKSLGFPRAIREQTDTGQVDTQGRQRAALRRSQSAAQQRRTPGKPRQGAARRSRLVFHCADVTEPARVQDAVCE